MQYVRRNFFAGEDFIDLAEAQRRAVQWCHTTAGMRVHGTTQLQTAIDMAVWWRQVRRGRVPWG